MEKVGTYLPPAMTEQSESITPEAFAQMQCDWYNASTGNLTGYDCPKCKNRGYFAVLNDGYQGRKECECMIIRKNRKNMEKSGLADALDSMTFDSYICTEPWQERVKATAMDYADKHDGRWLYLAGQSGAGKTHLCTAVCGVLLQRGVSVRYEMWRKLCRDMQNFETRDKKFQEISECGVLYIDDFLKSAFLKAESIDNKGNIKPDKELTKEINIAFEIVNERYARKKPTIISSEIFIQDLFRIDGALAGRIRERCGGFVSQISNSNERNYRMK